MFTAALLRIAVTAKRSKQPKCPSTEEWVNKMWYIHIMQYYTAIKRNDIRIHATTQMHFENIMASKRSQTQRLHTV